MKQIEIIPLFNQTSPTWHDFANIRLAAQIDLDLAADSAEYLNAYGEYSEMWRWCRHIISFGAYDGDEMVGFIDAECASDRVGVGALYVLPEYQKMGIGRGLLSAVENAALIDAHRVGLTSLGHAVGFYQKQNYIVQPDRYLCYMEKRVGTAGRVPAIVPVFHSTPRVTRECRAICPDYKIGTVNRSHKPMFVYIDENGCIGGFIDATGVYIVGRHGAAGQMTHDLARQMATYIAQRAVVKRR